MSMRRQRWLERMLAWSPAFLLGALAAMTYWLNTQVRPVGSATDGTSRHDPDLIAEHFNAVSLDAEGHVRQSLSAARAKHYPDDDSTHFEQARIVFTDPEKPQIEVTADRATLTADHEHVYLEGHAKVVRAGTGGDKPEGPITVTSEYLDVMPKDDRVFTDRPVTITDPRGTVNATGLELDNKAKTVKFRSALSGQLQPRNTSP
ncbi:MAG TPA: LPS export ABC transporter periplasmic protein LptC [Casimicrobiaceae bacterium]|nr:LPS export ABC transporter periplasmic protein LptC [Casimicrobiaceae bacterium]